MYGVTMKIKKNTPDYSAGFVTTENKKKTSNIYR
jgi:hypothetical protein